MLPQIFRPDDPLLQVSFATEHMLELERLLTSLPTVVFTASDALGWVYQYWQSKKKEEVNSSEVKIGADEISAVTQLFTEPYMVEFLLHNTLGAWWAGKKLAAEDATAAKTEDELRAKLALPGVEWEYLRFVRGTNGEGGPWSPAAGTFDGWPKATAELKVLDPCCGSGHFLVAAVHHLVPIRMAEEDLLAVEAVDAVLRDNIHGLEIDERCCQIAAFALAFAAWTYPEASGYRELPEMHIACTGVGPQASKAQWLELAENAAAKGHMPAKRDLLGKEESLLSNAVTNALESLYDLFTQAPTLGSLIDPRRVSNDLYHANYETLVPLLTEVFKAEVDDETRERAIAAAGMVKAADILADRYTLVITNVPYLGRSKQSDLLKAHLERCFKDGKGDLATAFVLRCLGFATSSGTCGMVMPQQWCFGDKYAGFRRGLIRGKSWDIVARLGVNAFAAITGEVVNVLLTSLSNGIPLENSAVSAIDVSGHNDPGSKSHALRMVNVSAFAQLDQLANPDSRVTLENPSKTPLLGNIAKSTEGLSAGDGDRFILKFWENSCLGGNWQFLQSAPPATNLYSGLTDIVRWEDGRGEMARSTGARIRGHTAWQKNGIVVAKMHTLRVSIYMGGLFAKNCAVMSVRNADHCEALYEFLQSTDCEAEVRRLDPNLNTATSVFEKVRFDLGHWQKVAAEKHPDGLPEPESDDPTQWLFHGRPDESTDPLQTAVARLLGYRWPAELDADMRLSKRARTLVKRCAELAKFTDDDGIVCIPSVRGEEPGVERLLALLAAARVKTAKVRELAGEADLDDWLRNSFFEEHCKLFHSRPFVWHIWDGRRHDGFHALVNYHRLAEGGGKGRKVLESLTYSYLGDWITRQTEEVKRGEGGAEDRLAAAMELQNRLKSILEGEPPFDIFVRWKPLHEQPIGWKPDINDGVRMNIRPFLASDLPNGRKGAGILRIKPNIKWKKDRGKEPKRPKAEYPWFWGWDETTEDFMGGQEFNGNRWNACHYTNKAKQAAREAAEKGDE